MAILIPLLILALPLIEIAGFVLVGGQVGVGATLGLTVLTAVVGLYALRFQGLSLPARARETFGHGEPPVAEALIELARAFGGLLLLIPGFFTDFIGILLLVPPVRLGAIYLLLAYLARRARREDGETVIDVSYTDVTPTPPEKQIDKHREGSRR
jgi:UPF0716 family protein affecting phage T7 exclusion